MFAKLKYILFVLYYFIIIHQIPAQQKTDSISQLIELEEVRIVSDLKQTKQKSQSLDIIMTDRNYLHTHRSNSLMSTLDKLPGISAMQIGQGFSKPVIRGLGFNRVAVVEAGIKQQGQQWGADHGLEIDQFNVEDIEIIKGPVSLRYGSDAIAGVITLQQPGLKEDDGFSGSLTLDGRLNNKAVTSSFEGHYQKDGKFITGRFTTLSFEDYRVPADSFKYLGWTFPVHNNRLKNTAGRENDLFIRTGIIKNGSTTILSLSNVNSKTGFFAGAHGIPGSVQLEDDGNYRNIDLPYQKVNHLKVILNESVWLNQKNRLKVDLGYQYNKRREFSKPHSHGIAPVSDSNLELELKLQTLTLNGVLEYFMSENNTFDFGFNNEYQKNRIGGYSFLMPQFEQYNGGLFIINRHKASDKLNWISGVRYDFANIHILEFIDPYLSSEYRQRSPNMKKNDGDFSFSIGLVYNPDNYWNFKANIGKSFRVPTANEYSSNGVHHGTFRHELGDSTLNAEKSYQSDLSASYTKELNGFIDKLHFSASFFANYFPNFIFLNPTGNFSWLPEAGQYYQYEQSKAMRYGSEFELKIDFARRFKWSTSGDYVYAKDLKSDYPIPFTPPLRLLNEFSVNPFSTVNFGMAHKYTASQNRVSRNEPATPDSHLFDLNATYCFLFNRGSPHIILSFQVQNMFDTKSYNHLSFYRYLDLPEIGRNIILSVQLLFN
jgi:iron complex outermembrane receptor protein